MHTPESLTSMNLGDVQRLCRQLSGVPTRSPNKVSLVKKVLAAQAEQAQGVEEATTTGDSEAQTADQVAASDEPETVGTAETAPSPAHDDLATRLAAVRAASTLEALDAIVSTPGRRIQAAVIAEVAKQREALTRVADRHGSPTERDDLRAKLASAQAHSRPGLASAIRVRLAELGVEADAPAGKPLAKMTDDELLAEYTRVVGRATGSTHRGYLIWKIREALKGRVTVAAVERVKREEGVEINILPLRMPAPTVDALDVAWKRLGYASRMAFVREAMSGLMAAKGEGEGEAAKLVGA